MSVTKPDERESERTKRDLLEGQLGEGQLQFLPEQELQVLIASSNIPSEVGVLGLPFPRRVEFRVEICHCHLLLTAPCYA